MMILIVAFRNVARPSANKVLRMFYVTVRNFDPTDDPISVVALSKTWVCGLSLAGIASSDPAGGIEVCLL
jgi:hypothetical protein